MAPAVPGASVARMEAAFVGNLEYFRGQRRAEPLFDLGNSLTRRPGRQGITWMKGLT